MADSARSRRYVSVTFMSAPLFSPFVLARITGHQRLGVSPLVPLNYFYLPLLFVLSSSFKSPPLAKISGFRRPPLLPHIFSLEGDPNLIQLIPQKNKPPALGIELHIKICFSSTRHLRFDLIKPSSSRIELFFSSDDRPTI